MLFYRAALPLSCQTLNYAAGIIRRHRKSIGLPTISQFGSAANFVTLDGR